MDRLTEWNREHTHGQIIKGDGYTKLARYEDTGLESEEIADFRENYRAMTSMFADYKAAEVTGRLVILPCKPADTVYIIEGVYKGKKLIRESVVPAQVDRIIIGGSGKPVLDCCTEDGKWYISLEPWDYYLTREAAEADLREMGE